MPEPHRADDQIQIPDLPQPVPAATEQDEVTEGEPLRVGADKCFRPYDPNQILLLPPNLSEWLPAGDLARLLKQRGAKALGAKPTYASLREQRGAPPYDPRMTSHLLT